MSHVGRVARQTAFLTVAQFTGLGISLLGTILVARALGPEGRAVYAWLVTLVGIAIQIALIAPPAVVRSVALSAPRRLPATLVLLSLAGSLLTLPLAAYVLLDGHIGPEARPHLLLAWLCVPVTATTLALTTLLQIEARVLPVLAVHVWPRIIQVAFLLYYWLQGRLDLSTAIAVFVFTAVLELVLALACLGPRIDSPKPSLELVHRITALLGAGWIASLAIFAVPRIGLIVLGSHAPLDETGLYSVALTIQEAALVGPAAFGGVLITHVGRHGWFSRSTRMRGGASVLAFSASTCAIAAAVAPEFIALTFGPSFGPSASALRVLLISVVLATLYQMCQPILFSRGRAVPIAFPSLAACGIALAVALVAVPRLGVSGAILSNLAGFTALVVLGWAFSLVELRRPAAVSKP
ncbi:oligosaccharide flippase family protein [Enterovirga aerilata]|uniref:Oligosaccharide flippase family protein n=1 Tax=Enterovirga aerilata TaxID=2730920 RepID=A0A849IA18_9HYPH|nr:oligosaccharide flippase family protein [Enterovirga sp. DB1703]NNM73115.1 oligosaccharide flippase family protein [Enterovirga sp. DB1703]